MPAINQILFFCLIIHQCCLMNFADADGQHPPNIILIMADDIGYECFGCYGSKQYQTPEIDRMAEAGMRFTHCYSQPLCTPSRVKLMTGLSNVRNYSAFSILNRNQKTFGHYLKQAGYQTAVAGKWQLFGANHYDKRFRGKGVWPKDAGFDRHCLWQIDNLGERYWGPLLNRDGKEIQFGQQKYGPDVVTDYLLEFITKNKDRPFLAYYPMILVHNPFPATPDSQNRNSKDKQKNFEDMVTYMDQLIGRIRSKVTELNIEQQTLIMFIGDNGTNKAIRSELNGRTIRGGKGQTNNTGTRVPFVACWPGTIPAGRVSDTLVDFSDFLPTLLHATGQPVPAHLDGHSFLPQLQGQMGKPREWMFCYYNPRPERTKPDRFVRDQRWKLYGDGRFYDVEHDDMEQQPIKNPAADPATQAAYANLSKALQSMPETGQSLLRYDEK